MQFCQEPCLSKSSKRGVILFYRWSVLLTIWQNWFVILLFILNFSSAVGIISFIQNKVSNRMSMGQIYGIQWKMHLRHISQNLVIYISISHWTKEQNESAKSKTGYVSHILAPDKDVLNGAKGEVLSSSLRSKIRLRRDNSFVTLVTPRAQNDSGQMMTNWSMDVNTSVIAYNMGSALHILGWIKHLYFWDLLVNVCKILCYRYIYCWLAKLSKDTSQTNIEETNVGFSKMGRKSKKLNKKFIETTQ